MRRLLDLLKLIRLAWGVFRNPDPRPVEILRQKKQAQRLRAENDNRHGF